MVKLNVIKLPLNRLALTNKVYVHPTTFQRIISNNNKYGDNDKNASDGDNDDTTAEKKEPVVFVMIVMIHQLLGSNGSIYMVEPHDKIRSKNQIALSVLQRDHVHCQVGTTVCVRSLSIVDNCTTTTMPRISSIEFAVQRLAPARPRKNPNDDDMEYHLEIDTPKLASAVATALEGHFLHPNQSVAIDFQSVKLKLTVTRIALCTATNATNNDNLDENEGTMQTHDDTTATTLRQMRIQTKAGRFIQAATRNIQFRPASGWDGNDRNGNNSLILTDNNLAPIQWNDIKVPGHDRDFHEVFRRAFASRVIRGNSHNTKKAMQQQQEPPRASQNSNPQNHHIKVLLLCGPAGCGKTRIALQLGNVLQAHYPKITSGYELYKHGLKEDYISILFRQAEWEQQKRGDQSRLHILVIPEMEDVFFCRHDGGRIHAKNGLFGRVVDRLFQKLAALDNVLLIGATTQKDLVVGNLYSYALWLRKDKPTKPRLKQQQFLNIDIGLPQNDQQRLEILHHYLQHSHDSNRLAQDVMTRLPQLSARMHGFEGSDLEGLVKVASSLALSRWCDSHNIDLSDFRTSIDNDSDWNHMTDLVVSYDDLERALQQILNQKAELSACKNEDTALPELHSRL